jgi:hypothetical protein
MRILTLALVLKLAVLLKLHSVAAMMSSYVPSADANTAADTYFVYEVVCLHLK